MRSKKTIYGAVWLLVGFSFFVTGWYVIHQWQTEWAQKSSAFDPLIEQAANRHAISPFLIKAVIKRESNFQPHAVGNSGEIGLMQITEAAATDWNKRYNRKLSGKGLLFNPRLNIEIGTWYLAKALRRWQDYRHATVLALAQYNAGPQRSLKWKPKDKRQNPLNNISFPSTQQYIKDILAQRDIYKEQARFK